MEHIVSIRLILQKKKNLAALFFVTRGQNLWSAKMLYRQKDGQTRSKSEVGLPLKKKEKKITSQESWNLCF